MCLEEIHSGGQTGADQGGLAAARVLGLRTGGVAPKGWRTESGSAPGLAKLGLEEDESSSYRPRTIRNVEETDGTFWFGNASSPGGKLTLRSARDAGKPVFIAVWWSGQRMPADAEIERFREWLQANDIRVLNVAGNRESSQPGIAETVRDFLVIALSE